MTGITATRDDDSFFSFFTPKKVTIRPTELVDAALSAFNDAHANLVDVQTQIAAQKAEHEAQLFELANKVAECAEQHSRLDRIRDRLKEFLA